MHSAYEGNSQDVPQAEEALDASANPDVVTATDAPPQYGVGPFSIREISLVGVWLVAFIVSFFSLNLGAFQSVWTMGLMWILTIGLPTVAVFLIVLRRLSPDGIRRVGSLGIDQFASVAFSVSAVLWIHFLWETVAWANQPPFGVWVRSWVLWVELVLMLAGVALTVFAPIIPTFAEDFRGRREVVAHRLARPIQPVTQRPAREPRPAPAPAPAPAPTLEVAPAPAPEYTSAPEPIAETAPVGEAIATAGDAPTIDDGPAADEAQVDSAASEQPDASHQAFWALVPVERDVVDDRGAPLFRVGPTAWALVIEDRGETFVVRHDDGRVGFLHDVSGVLRG